MKHVFKTLAILGAAALLGPAARAADINFNKRGDSERSFVAEVGSTVTKSARTTAKDLTLQDYKFKEVKPGRTDLIISEGYRGGVTRTKYSADIVVHLDTTDKNKWEVLRIDYNDNNKSPVPWNRKNVENLVSKFNSESR